MKNHTLTELTKEVNRLNLQITTLKNESAANTQAIGKNTIAVEAITKGLTQLAAQTGAWRKDDAKHHEKEGKLDAEKIQKMESLETALKELVSVLKK